MSGISLTGLASGLNTTDMVEALMKLERLPYNNLGTKKTNLTNEQSIVRSLNTKLVALRSAISDLNYSSSFNVTSAKVSDSSVFSVTSTDQAATGSYNISVTKMAKKHVVSSKEFNVTNDAKDSALTGTFKLYGNGSDTPTEITLTGATNKEILNNLKNSINSAKKGVTASIVETTPGKQTLVLTSDKFGLDSDMQFGAPSGKSDTHTYFGNDANSLDLLDALGVRDGNGNLFTRQAADNAEVNVNSITIVSSSNELKDVAPGLTINLLKEGPSAQSTVTVSKDSDKVAAKIQAFVDAYNDAITAIRSNTAKGAAMQGDSTLRSLQSELSDLVNGEVKGSGAYKFLFDIGLEIDKGITSGSEMTGKLSFDKSKFTSAFTKDPDSVYKLFASEEGTKSSEKGIATRMNSSLFNWTKSNTGFMSYKLSGYDAEIKMITQQMADMDLRLQAREKKLQAQFSAMETALSSLHNQQSWLSSQINSLG